VSNLGVEASATGAIVIWWRLMTSFFRSPAPRLAVAATAFAALVTIAMPVAGAAPITDEQGFVDSTARCSSPDTAAAFGSTATSRVAICKSPSGKYEYRGVRIRDGAKLVLVATRSASGAFIAENDGITYALTSSTLTVSAGSQEIRQEPISDYHGPSTSSSSTTPTTSVPSAAPETPTPTTPLPPPLPAEAGHG
jgi:hypothetical protein